jgi:hypothetical protein
MRSVAAVLVLAACGGGGPYERDTEPADICARLVGACEPAAGELPAISEMVQVAPSELLPDGVVSQVSHNNLDITWFENRLFFAFRTAPTHFASDEVVMYIVSTTDQQEWVLEQKIELLRDVREPRFLQVGGKLFFYFAVLGYAPVAFEPQYTMVSEYLGPAEWSEPEQIFDPGFIPWRTRAVSAGEGQLMGYVGGENIYEIDGEPIQMYWLKTADGRTWEPVVAGQPVMLEGGTSETDWAYAADGALIVVSRNEAGDETGFGSKICRAEPEAPGDWTCVNDPKKYDSPLVIGHDGAIWLIGRRQVTEDGNYDLFRRDLPLAEQASMYNREYWTTPKRCSLWRVDPDTLAVTFALDLPSNGDTCFASAVPLGGDQYLVYNYTSPLDDPYLDWVDGQTNPTFIYRVTLTLP